MGVAEILGREAEVQAVGRFLDGPAPGALVLEGPAGIGKTTVWRAGLEHALGAGHRVLVTRPSEVETAPAMAGLMDLFGELFDQHGDALPPPQRTAMAVALLRAEGDHDEVPPGTVSAAALGLMRHTAQASPVLLAIDDLQWLDRATSATLTFALRRLGDAPVQVLATARADEGEPPAIAGERMAIPPLDAELLSRLISRELGRRLAWPVVRRIAEIAGGNAFLAVELARVASQPGTDPDELSPSALSRSAHARRLAETRVRVLPEPTRTALAVVAALGEPRGAVLSRMLEDEAALDAAFDASVIEEQGDRVRFTHPLLAAGALASLSPRRRRSIHRALAERADTAEERARHLAAATSEPSAEVAAAVDLGAADALSRGAPSAAAQLYEESVRLTPAGNASARGRRLLAAGACREQAADPTRALELFQQAVLDSPAGPERARAHAAVATHEQVPLRDSVPQLRLALEECGSDLAARTECVLGIGVGLTIMGEARDGRRHLEEAVRLAATLDDLALRATVLSTAGHLLEAVSPGTGRNTLETAAALAEGSLAPSAQLSPEALLGTLHTWADEFEAGRALLLRVRERAITAGDELGAAGTDMWLTELETRAGRLEEARSRAAAALAVLDTDRCDQNLGAALWGRALVAAHEGDAELARGLVAKGMAIHEALADRIFATHHRSVLGFLELSLDQPVEALGHLAAVDDDVRAMGMEEPGVYVHRNDLPEALIGAGRMEEARQRLNEMHALGPPARPPTPAVHRAAWRGDACGAPG